MGETMKHLVVAKFKEGVVVEDIINGMHQLVSHIHQILSFEWGEDVESPEMLRQGYTHAFFMSFNNKDDYAAFLSHPKHLEFSAVFSSAIDKVLLLDFPAALLKPAASEPPVEPPPSVEQRTEPLAEQQAEPLVEQQLAPPAASVN